MSSFNFKSSGVQLYQTTSNIPPVTASIPIGIKTPIQAGTSDREGFLAMNFFLVDQISDNLRNLVQTNWGERLGQYSYGANLKPLLTELVSSEFSQENFETAAINNIKRAISTWMPYVSPQTLVTSINFDENKISRGSISSINLVITYDVPSIQINNKKLVVVLRAI
jgi:phage baseplate assembly protein W